ncbi:MULTISPECIES: acyl-CoA dehydrogenase family protein [Peribacillus]|uniref:acyl-CoA dehydrogenase family protein n=1 Tax=Peribacillus TaxID=2675229 RepID=UPI0024E1B244|nr:acyl-CoA dehydrogenase family protein [Peribacillus simplex]MDF9761545.1 alkylation response protein AidB-like acyl-CoA dehydrogenase [Peribacillus simplex]
MSFFQSQKQKEYIQKLEEAIQPFSSRSEALDDSKGFPFENIQELKEFGYPKLTLAKADGGNGGSLYDFLLCQEKIAQYCGPTALGIGWHVGTVLSLTEKRPWEKGVMNELFDEVSKGALINTAASEVGTGSPTRGGRPETLAIKKGEQWNLNGRKTFTTLSPVLNIFLVTAWVPEDERLGTFLVHRDLMGVSIEETWDMMSMQGTGSHDLVLNDVSLPEKYYVMKSNLGEKRKPEAWLLHIPACYLGIAVAARNYAVEFAKTYSPNSLPGPIRDLPNVQRTIGEMELELSEAHHFLYSVAEKWEQHPEDRDELSKQLGAVKLSVVNKSISIVDKAMRVVGAKSLQRKNPLQRYYRDVRAGLHNPPMDDATITMLAKSALY